MESRIASLERTVKRLQFLSACLLGLLLIPTIAAFRTLPGQEEVLRVRGLVIVDDFGRDRILLGAPVPESSDRVRTDPTRVREFWAGRFPDPDAYMGYYEDYSHITNGLLVLDERGFDRLAFGDPVPDPNIGRRIGPSTGIVINDNEGFEWSGYGLLTVDDKKRVVLGLDSHDGEAVMLSVFESGHRGLSVFSPGSSMFLGKAPANDRLTGLEEELFGLVLKEGDEITRLPDRSSGR